MALKGEISHSHPVIYIDLGRDLEANLAVLLNSSSYPSFSVSWLGKFTAYNIVALKKEFSVTKTFVQFMH